MTQIPDHPAPDQIPPHDAAGPPIIGGDPVAEGLPPPAAPPPRRGSVLPILYALGFVMLGVAIFWLWQTQPEPQPEAATPAQLAEVSAQVTALQERLAALEKRPAPTAPTVDLKPLDARLSALENRPAPAATAAATGGAGGAGFDARPLMARIEALEKRPGGEGASPADLAKLSQRVDALASQQQQMARAEQALDATALAALPSRVDAEDQKIAAVAGKVDGFDKRLGAIEGATGASAKQLAALGDQATRIGRLTAARVALETGRPLGQIPGAPPALTKFTTVAAPTEASLRLSFPEVARRAHDAAVGSTLPGTEGQQADMWTRMRDRVQGLLTVREGDRVIIGDQAAGVIAHARVAIDAGDLAGAVSALGALAGPAAETFGTWRAQAQSLLDARAALATLASGA